MKKLFLLSVVALFSVSLLAQEKKMVEFAKTVYDFGTVAEGSGSGGIISTTFSFKNLGSSPIFIENARTSCGCTTPKVDLTKPIAPGEAGQIPVAYNTNGRPGSFNKEVTITFKNAAGETSVEKIYIKGRVTAKGSQNVEPEAREDEPKSDMSKQQERSTRKTKKVNEDIR